MNLHELLAAKYVGKQYSLKGDQYANLTRLISKDPAQQVALDEAALSGLRWVDASPKPTLAELSIKWDEYLKEKTEANLLNKQLAKALVEGYPTAYGYTMALDQKSWILFGVLLAGFTNIGYPENGPVKLWDKDDVKFILTFAQFKELMKSYFIVGYDLFDKAKGA